MSEPAPHRRLQAVPDNPLEASPYLAEIERLRGLLRDAAVENSKLVEEVDGALTAAKAAGKEVQVLKGQLTKQARARARSEQVEAIIDHWIKHRPKTDRKRGFPPGGPRWQMIEKALSIVDDPDDPDNDPIGALKEAVDGAHLCPYLHYTKRRATGEPSELRNKPEDVFRDEIWIERARSAYRWASALPAERCWVLYEVTSATSEAWLRLAMDHASADTCSHTVPNSDTVGS